MDDQQAQQVGIATQEQRFVSRLRELRKARGWNQSDLARELEKVGLQWRQQTVARAENEGRPIRLDEAHAIATLFGESVESMTSPIQSRANDIALQMAAAGISLLRSFTNASEVDEDLDRLLGDLDEASPLPAVLELMRVDLWKTLCGAVPEGVLLEYEEFLHSEPLRAIYNSALPLVPATVSEGWWEELQKGHGSGPTPKSRWSKADDVIDHDREA